MSTPFNNECVAEFVRDGGTVLTSFNNECVAEFGEDRGSASLGSCSALNK